MNTFFFAVYPYICLSLFTAGLIFRYLATPLEWNSRSSNLFAKKSLAFGSYIFHYAIIFAFFGHIIGLLIPSYILAEYGLTLSLHQMLAGYAGKLFAPAVIIGLAILLLRRLFVREVLAATVLMDIAVILFIMFQGLSGGYQDYDSNFNVFNSVAPWIRGVLTLRPDPGLMACVPPYLKFHAICGLAIIAMIPFSRLVHFISTPVAWVLRPVIEYRRRYENL